MKKLQNLNLISGGTPESEFIQNFVDFRKMNPITRWTEVSLEEINSLDCEKYYGFQIDNFDGVALSIGESGFSEMKDFELDPCPIGQGIKISINGSNFTAIQVGN